MRVARPQSGTLSELCQQNRRRCKMLVVVIGLVLLLGVVLAIPLAILEVAASTRKRGIKEFYGR